MMNFIENAGRIAARIQAIGVGFDPEVLSLPGGSFIAAFLWLNGSAVSSLKRWALKRWASHKHSGDESVAVPACAGCFGRR